MLVSQSVTLADFTDVTLVSKDAAHNSLQMSSFRDLTDESEERDLTYVHEDAAQNYLQTYMKKRTFVAEMVFFKNPNKITKFGGKSL